MPAFVVVSYSAVIPGSAKNAFEAFLDLAGPRPIGFKGSGDGIEPALQAYPQLKRFLGRRDLNVVGEDGLPEPGLLTHEMVTDLLRQRRYPFGSKSLLFVADGPVLDEALGLGAPIDRELGFPFSARPVMSIERSAWNPRASLGAGAAVLAPARGKNLKRVHADTARFAAGQLGGKPTALWRSVWATEDVQDATRSQFGTRPHILTPQQDADPIAPEPRAAPAPEPFNDPLARAEAAVRDADTTTAQAALLQAWREIPHAELADALDLVAFEHLARHGGMRENGSARKERLEALATSLPVEEQPAFAAALAEESARSMARLILKAPQPDPRWTRRVLRWLRGGRHRSPDATEALCTTLTALADDLRWTWQDVDLGDQYQSIRMRNAVDETQIQRPTPVELPAHWKGALARIVAGANQLGKPREARRNRLREAVQTGDRVLLQVAADSLLEEGDPLGRFAQLQLLHEERGKLPGKLKNELHAMQRAWRCVWAHPLTDERKDVELRFGFVV